MKILHICPDDKFIDQAIENVTNYNIADVEHKFIVITKFQSLRYIKSKIDMKSRKSLILSILMGQYSKYDVVVFHSFIRDFAIISKLLKKNIIRVWIGWGFDYYCFSGKAMITDYPEQKKTLIQVIRNKLARHKLVSLLYTTFFSVNEHEKFDYFCPVLESEFELFRFVLSDKAKYLDWNYGSQTAFYEKILSSNIVCEGNGIFVGNSADPTNNHVDILRRLNNINRPIYMPLSYGDDNYRNWLKDKIKTFNYDILILENFLTVDAYLTHLSQCNVMIMNHVRQQAAGNVGIGFLIGMTIYLNKTSPLLIDLRNRGFHIYETQDINDGNKLKLLTNEEKLFNKELAIQEFGESKMMQKIKGFILTLASDVKKYS